MAQRDDINLREFCVRYRNGEYSKPDFDTQVRAGWYDWFCKDKELLPRLKKIWKILDSISNGKLLDSYYVWFKNNCPVKGPLYDDVRFEPLDQEKRKQLYFLISIDDRRESEKYCVYTARNGYQKEAGFNRLPDVVDFLNKWKPEKAECEEELL